MAATRKTLNLPQASMYQGGNLLLVALVAHLTHIGWVDLFTLTMIWGGIVFGCGLLIYIAE